MSPGARYTLTVTCVLGAHASQYGEIRLQFHVVTDGHDQMRPSIAAFRDTTKAFGQPDVELVTSDKAYEDKPFYHEVLPTLKDAELRFNAGEAENLSLIHI